MTKKPLFLGPLKFDPNLENPFWGGYPPHGVGGYSHRGGGPSTPEGGKGGGWGGTDFSHFWGVKKGGVPPKTPIFWTGGGTKTLPQTQPKVVENRGMGGSGGYPPFLGGSQKVTFLVENRLSRPPKKVSFFTEKGVQISYIFPHAFSCAKSEPGR